MLSINSTQQEDFDKYPSNILFYVKKLSFYYSTSAKYIQTFIECILCRHISARDIPNVIFQCLFFFQFLFRRFFVFFCCMCERNFSLSGNLVNKSLSSPTSIAFFITETKIYISLSLKRSRLFILYHLCVFSYQLSCWRSHKKNFHSEIAIKTYHWPSLAFFLCHNETVFFC